VYNVVFLLIQVYNHWRYWYVITVHSVIMMFNYICFVSGAPLLMLIHEIGRRQ